MATLRVWSHRRERPDAVVSRPALDWLPLPRLGTGIYLFAISVDGRVVATGGFKQPCGVPPSELNRDSAIHIDFCTGGDPPSARRSLTRGRPTLCVQAASRPPLAAALAEYGRLVRSNFLLAYLAVAPLRRIGAQLNRGKTVTPCTASSPPANANSCPLTKTTTAATHSPRARCERDPRAQGCVLRRPLAADR